MPLKGETCNGGTACRTSGTQAGYTWCTAGHTAQCPRQYLSCPHFLHLKSSPHFNDARYFTQLSSSGNRSWHSNTVRLSNSFSITSRLCYRYSGFFCIEKVPSSIILYKKTSNKM